MTDFDEAQIKALRALSIDDLNYILRQLTAVADSLTAVVTFLHADEGYDENRHSPLRHEMIGLRVRTIEAGIAIVKAARG